MALSVPQRISPNWIFNAIIEISKTCMVAVKDRISSLVTGIFTIGGAIAGAVVGGGRGALAGTLMGSRISQYVTSDETIYQLAEYLLVSLPNKLRTALEKFFEVIFAPFRVLNTAVENFVRSPEQLQKFVDLMQMFFNQNNIAARCIQ